MISDVLDGMLLVAGKDLRIELRSRTLLRQVAPFVFAVVLVFGFALDADSVLLRRAAAGLFWMTVLFAAFHVVTAAAANDRDPGVADALRLARLPPAAIFAGRALALFVQLVIVELLLGGVVVLLYDVPLRGLGLISTSGLLAAVCIAAAGALYGPLAAGGRRRDAVLPLLLLPVLAPVLLAGARSFEVALGRGVGNGWGWTGMLGVFAVLYLCLGALVAGPLLEDT
jgi:heme exporter protein B